MLERLTEFNRYALRTKLKSIEETKELVQEIIHMLQNTYPKRYYKINLVYG